MAVIKKKHTLFFGSIERIIFRYKACRPFTCGILGLVTQQQLAGTKVLGIAKIADLS